MTAAEPSTGTDPEAARLQKPEELDILGTPGEARATAAPAAPRRRVLKAGKIRHLNGRISYDCTVRSLGDDGATLSVSSPVGVPDDFVLAIPADRFEAACHVAGRSEHALEVSFTKR